MRRNAGVALLLAVMLLALLIVLVASMVITSGNAERVSENSMADLQNTMALRSAYHRAVLYLQADAESGASYDSLHDRWAPELSFSLGVTNVTMRIEDEERRFNLSKMTLKSGGECAAARDIGQRLAGYLGHPAERMDRILDYEDANTDGLYEQGARNALLFKVEEILRIRGFTSGMLYGDPQAEALPLFPYVTVFPRVGATVAAQGPAVPQDVKVNVNTAPAEVLAALSDQMTLELGKAMAAHREGLDEQGKPRVFKSTSDLSQVQGMTPAIVTSITPHVAFSSSTFTIRAEATTGTMKKAWVYVVTRGGQQGVTLLTQYRHQPYQELKPPE